MARFISVSFPGTRIIHQRIDEFVDNDFSVRIQQRENVFKHFELVTKNRISANCFSTSPFRYWSINSFVKKAPSPVYPKTTASKKCSLPWAASAGRRKPCWACQSYHKRAWLEMMCQNRIPVLPPTLPWRPCLLAILNWSNRTDNQYKNIPNIIVLNLRHFDFRHACSLANPVPFLLLQNEYMRSGVVVIDIETRSTRTVLYDTRPFFLDEPL